MTLAFGETSIAGGTSMRRRVRSLLAVLVAVVAILMTVPPVFAQSYTSTLRFWDTLWGQCRTYSGTAIHIQLTTYVENSGGGDSGTYSISVYRCSGGQPSTLVGGAGSCNYPGFCGYGWSIALGGQQYAFKFKKTSGDYHDIIASDSVQMWST
jgi:hypothetical protein